LQEKKKAEGRGRPKKPKFKEERLEEESTGRWERFRNTMQKGENLCLKRNYEKLKGKKEGRTNEG